MLLEDIAELSEHDVKFYRGVHANSLESVAPAQGYILRDLDTLEPLKYGMTTREGGRYSKAELKKMNAFMDFVTDGSVADMRAWETKQIKDYVTGRGERPPYNHSDH